MLSSPCGSSGASSIRRVGCASCISTSESGWGASRGGEGGGGGVGVRTLVGGGGGGANTTGGGGAGAGADCGGVRLCASLFAALRVAAFRSMMGVETWLAGFVRGAVACARAGDAIFTGFATFENEIGSGCSLFSEPVLDASGAVDLGLRTARGFLPARCAALRSAAASAYEMDIMRGWGW